MVNMTRFKLIGTAESVAFSILNAVTIASNVLRHEKRVALKDSMKFPQF